MQVPAGRQEEAEGEAKGGEEGGSRKSVTACHAAGGPFVKQRRLDIAEAGGEDFTAGIAAGGEREGVGDATAFDAAGRGGVGRATASGGAVEGGGQTSLASLL